MTFSYYTSFSSTDESHYGVIEFVWQKFSYGEDSGTYNNNKIIMTNWEKIELQQIDYGGGNYPFSSTIDKDNDQLTISSPTNDSVKGINVLPWTITLNML